MNYRLTWINHWSTQQESTDPRVIIRYTEESDGWFEHEYVYYFFADDDEDAKRKAREYVASSQDEIDIFSLTNRETKQTILTEEDK